MIDVKVESLDKDIEAIVRADLSPEAQKKALAEFAKAKLLEGQRQNWEALGYVPPHETFVDGSRRDDLESVRPEGTIVFEFGLINDLFQYVGDLLVRHSPHLTGAYAGSHALYADGVALAPGEPIPPASEYVFVNLQPYARKIERGLSPQAPEGVYEVVAQMAARRFGNMAKIRFSYRSPLAGAVMGWAQTGSARALARSIRGGRESLHTDWLTRNPAIVITHR